MEYMEYASDIYVSFAVVIWIFIDSRGVFIHIWHCWFIGNGAIKRLLQFQGSDSNVKRPVPK